MQCQHIYRQGANKGKQCQKTSNEPFCNKHSLKMKEYMKEYQAKYSKPYRAKNPGYFKAYYMENKERVNEISKKYMSIRWDIRILNNCNIADKKYNREFNLDKDWIDKMLYLQGGYCYVCADEMLLTNGKRDPKQVSINRIDNSIGHIKGNVVLTCLHCNMKQHTKHMEDFYHIEPDFILTKDNLHILEAY